MSASMAEMSSSMAVTGAMDAPMSSSFGAMGPLLRKLDSLLPPDYRLPKLLKDRIGLLKADLEEISVALVEQSMVGSPNEMSRYWMNEVRELIYEIEDFIDNMMSTHADAKMRSVQSYKVGRVKIAWLPKRLKPCTRAAKITELRALVQEAIERHQRYLDGCTSSSRCVLTGYGRIPALYAEAANNLVGVDDSKAKLVKWLTDEQEKQLKVVAIVGPAGVGKTTLAKQVYHELGEQFTCRALVRASRKPDMRRLLGGILSQIQERPEPSDSGTVQDLIDNLTEHLQDKRYVIVIDDLWETIAWDIVASAFPEGNNRSIVITTAEDEGVVLECCNYQSDNILKMNRLGREDSEILFFNTVFGPGNSCPEQLKEVSDIIITACAGLPLATVCVAGLLASQPDSSELWQHVQEYLSSNLNTNSRLEDILNVVLKFSYCTLPRHLKTCLMYLSMYPEGHTLWKVDLVKQWISEGFISSPEGKEREEVAQSYFFELANRRMILPVDTNNNGEILSCKVHHTVLDLITLESNEENFVTSLDYSHTITGLYSKARRLSLHFSNTRYATKPAGLTLSQVRSLAFFGILQCMPSIVEFKFLRVLILEFWGYHQGSTSLNLTNICRLSQLKYLKISCDASVEVELPTQVQMLRYLETLIIDAVVSIVPLDIIHLPGLWHLSLGNKIDLPDDIGHMKSLRTLHYFDIGSNSEDNVLSLGDLINLQDLHLTYYKEADEHYTEESYEHMKSNLAALASSLGKLDNLKSVTLAPGDSGAVVYHDVWSSMSSFPVFLQRLELLPPICIFSRLPECIGKLQKLNILKVVVSELLMEDMDILTGLPVLAILSLYVRQLMAESIIFKRGAFLRLKYFKFSCGVLPLAFEEEALPNLQRLELSFNSHRGEKYDHLLLGIHHVSNLKEIAGTIGAAASADESDRRAAESAFKEAIRKHPRFPSYDNVKRVDWVTEEYQFRTQEKDSSSEKHEMLQKERKINEGESSNNQSRNAVKETEEDTKQYVDSRYMDYPFPSVSIETGRWAAAGTDESDQRAAESACKEAIHKNPKFPSFDNVKRVDRLSEEYQLRTKEKDSPSEKQEILQIELKKNEGESSDDQSGVLVKESEQDTKQYVDSRISLLPAAGLISPSDETISDHLRQQQQQLELPPGFRYHPTDQEIITLYLIPKVLDRTFVTEAIGEVDLTKYDPWELPGQAKMGEREWYFYCHKKHKDSTWTHTHRATEAGYWKSTGKDRQISSQPPPVLIGMRKTLVFYIGRAPQGKKTAWVMHEYRIETRREQVYAASKDEWVVCRIFHKRSGVENVVMPSNAMTEMPMSMGDQQQSFVVDSVTTKRAPMANHLYQHHCQQQLELPPGFRYHPTHEEIITFYLIPKVLDRTFVTEAIGEVDLRKYEPWELPEKAKMGEKGWYFYCQKDCKYPTGTRTNQATEAGYWKATGRDKEISVSPPQVFVGMRKALVFYKGRAPRGEKTSWVMHEYRIETRKEHVPYATSSAVTAIIDAASKDKWVVCRIFDKSSGVENVVMPSYAMAAMPMSMGDQQQSFVVNSGTACTLPSLMDYSTSSSSLVPPQPQLHAAGTDTIDDAWFDDVWHGPANDETDTTLGTTATTSSRCR